jgi:hypothetical protein
LLFRTNEPNPSAERPGMKTVELKPGNGAEIPLDISHA